MSDFNYDQEAYRDSIATIGEDGKRNFIYPKKPKGKFYQWRTWVSIILLVLLFGLPHVYFQGEPLFLFNVLERKFIIFGIIFWPQDFFIFVLSALTAVVGIILFTVIYGRVWCGWMCPQTIFMEMVFRKIEYWIDGDYGQQKRLNKLPWNTEKVIKRVKKWVIFWIISFLIANTFLSYIIGSEALWSIVTDPPSQHIGGLIALIVFTFVFFFVFLWFREQACIAVCPYGRLQGVLLDKKSIQVAYDYVRGENRGRFKKREDRTAEGKGDCIDCDLCVAVCPTGIDIRNGSQMECVNCTACMDACDSVMEKVNLQKGLIRYASEEMISEKKPFEFNFRMKAYTGVLIVLMITVTAILLNRSVVGATIVRVPGTQYKKVETDILNIYNYKLINKSHEAMDLNFKLISHEGKIEVVGKSDGLITIENQNSTEGTMMIYIPRALTESKKTMIEVQVLNGDQLIETVDVTFSSPYKRKKK